MKRNALSALWLSNFRYCAPLKNSLLAKDLRKQYFTLNTWKKVPQ